MADICSIEDNPNLSYLVVVPDTVHHGKTYKCSWSNWFLLLGEGHRSSLATLRMLRNDSDPVVSEKLHKLLTAESVRNKDRMAVEPLLELTNQELLNLLKSMDTVFLTLNIVPDRYRISDSNNRGLYSHPFAISPASTRKLAFLIRNSKTNMTDLVQLRLHSSVETAMLHKNIQTSGISLCFMKGVALFCGQEGILFHNNQFKCKRCKTTETAENSNMEKVFLDGQVIEVVQRFCYLGDTIEARGASACVIARVRSGWSKFRELLPLLTSRALPLSTKGRVYQACVRSVVMYGSDTWPVRAEDMCCMERNDNLCE